MINPKSVVIVLTLLFLLFGVVVTVYGSTLGKGLALPCLLWLLTDIWYRYGKYVGAIEYLESNKKLDKLLERNS